MANAPANLANIPLSRIRENPVALRPVDKGSEEYLGLVDSIRKQGVMNAISVREIPNPDPNDKEPLYSVVDGLHRFTAAGDAGLETIPAQIVSKSDADVLEAQIVANIHKVETKPAQYSKQLNRMMIANPTLTVSDIASRLSKSPQWLTDRLGLVKLKEDIQKHVDEGRIKVSNAVGLAKLPPELQDGFVERAMTQTPAEFLPAVQQAIKQHRDALRAGKDPNAGTTFEPVAYMQKLSAIKDAAASPDALAQELIAAAQPKTPTDIFKLALNWVLHLDPKSVDAQRSKFDQQQKEKADKKAAAAAEREKKKAEAAQKALLGVA